MDESYQIFGRYKCYRDQHWGSAQTVCSRRVMRKEEPGQKHYRQKKQVQIARNKVLTDNRGQVSRLGVKQNPVGLEIEVTRFNHLHLSCMSTTF